MTDTENISKVTDIINDSHIGMLTTINEEGALVSRPLAVQEVKDDGDMWFFTRRRHLSGGPCPRESRGQRLLRQAHRVGFGGRAPLRWSPTGAKIHDMWNQTVEAWFPDGPDTPEVVPAPRRLGLRRVLDQPRRHGSHRPAVGEVQGDATAG